MIDPNQSPSMIRQRWIEEAAAMFKKHFAANWWNVPDNVRLSIGVPVGNRDGKKKLGICHHMEASQDGHWEIFINPEFTNANTTVETLETIAHEMVHATVAIPGHRGKFKDCALAIGFLPPMTYTPSGPKMKECIDLIIATIGQFPAGVLSQNGRKKQATNLKKCECMDCGYIARVTMKWIVSVGEPVCPLDKKQMVCE